MILIYELTDALLNVVSNMEKTRTIVKVVFLKRQTSMKRLKVEMQNDYVYYFSDL